MFGPDRDNKLTKVVWNADRDGHRNREDLSYYVDCWNYDGGEEVADYENWHEGWIDDFVGNSRQEGLGYTRIAQWLQRKGDYAHLAPKNGRGILQGGIRLLICDRSNTKKGMTISKASFELIESTFGLSPATLPSFFHHSGVFSKSIPKHTKQNANSRLSIVVKAYQKLHVANYLLSLSHDAESGWTYAFLCGDGAIKDRTTVPHRDYGLQREQVLDLIKSTVRFWNDPLLLPAILLKNYCQRTEKYIEVLQVILAESEEGLGVTAAGGVRRNPAALNPQHVKVTKITADLHRTMTEAIYMRGACEWARQYGKFLLDVEGKLHPEDSAASGQVWSTELRDNILHVMSALEGVNVRCNTFKERAQTQINVLFNIMSQQANLISRDDNRLNTRIASSAKKDSIAMITFTFITALFLPGSYVSSLFSMSMFDWQSSSGSLVSGHFWIYWAVVIPLTTATLLGWYAWYWYAGGIMDRELRGDGPIKSSRG